ncbi:hypothetical protein KSS87_017047 [Heliosperma pusillum]|nr:hypothetical protein KSS87_017047 [Heliosperma pusillum]
MEIFIKITMSLRGDMLESLGFSIRRQGDGYDTTTVIRVW